MLGSGSIAVHGVLPPRPQCRGQVRIARDPTLPHDLGPLSGWFQQDRLPCSTARIAMCTRLHALVSPLSQQVETALTADRLMLLAGVKCSSPRFPTSQAPPPRSPSTRAASSPDCQLARRNFAPPLRPADAPSVPHAARERARMQMPTIHGCPTCQCMHLAARRSVHSGCTAHLDQLPGAHRMPHARSGQAPCQKQNRKCIRDSAIGRGADQREGARSHFRHWEPGRCPLLPIAWLSPLHSRPMQAHQAAPAAEVRICRGDVDSTYPPREPASRLRRRGLSAPSSRFFSGSAEKVPQTLSARLSRAHGYTGRMDLVW